MLGGAACGSPDPEPDWDWDLDWPGFDDPSVDDGTVNNDNDGDGGGGQQDQSDRSEKAETIADVMVFLGEVKTEVSKILLLPNINPQMAEKLTKEIDKLGKLISKGNALVSIINSGTQAAVHIAEDEFLEAAAESAGFLAGLVAGGLVTAGGAAVAAFFGSPAWAAAVVAGDAAATGLVVSTYVEGKFPELVDELSDFFDEDFFDNDWFPNLPYIEPCDLDFSGLCRAERP